MTTKAASKTTAKAPAKTKINVTRTGVVDSDKRSKTRTVIVANPQIHAKYGKLIRKRTILNIHDEKNLCHSGDLVEIAPCVPVSKTKRWALVRIVRKSAAMKFEAVKAPEVEADKK